MILQSLPQLKAAARRRALVRKAESQQDVRFEQLLVGDAPHTQYLHELLDFRILTEGTCARIGAPERDPTTFATLKSLMATMAKTHGLGTKHIEYRRFVEADAQFHMAVVDSGSNEVMSGVYPSMHAILLQSRPYLNQRGGPTSWLTLFDEHRVIHEAYEHGDEKRADKVIREHLQKGRERLLAVMGHGAI